MIVAFTNAVVSVVLQIVLVAKIVRAARRAYRGRHRGPRATAHTALPGPLIILTCVYGVHRFCSRMLLLRGVRRIVQRAEGDTGRHEDQGRTP